MQPELVLWGLWSRGGPSTWFHVGPMGLCLYIPLDQPLDIGYGPPWICSSGIPEGLQAAYVRQGGAGLRQSPSWREDLIHHMGLTRTCRQRQRRCVRVPKTSPSFSDALGGPTSLLRYNPSQPQQRDTAASAKGAPGTKCGEDQPEQLPESSSCGVTGCTTRCDSAYEMSLTRDAC